MMRMIARRGVLKLAGATGAAALAAAIRIEGAAAASPSTAPLPFALTTPAHIEAASLKVRDLDAVAGYYRRMLGLEVIARGPGTLTMGAGGVPLLHLTEARGAAIATPDTAGLFHIAWLMPSREDLARWLVHVARLEIPIDGFADHNVSEAIYLTDPEGNGVEVYADRPRERWQWNGGIVTMGTNPLDIDAIVALTDPKADTYTVAPDRLRIGHMHLRVGDVATARDFYETGLGLAATRPGRADAAFLSSGGYHHHVAVNSWRSAGAPARDLSQTGLDWFSLRVNDFGLFAGQRVRLAKAGPITEVAGGFEARDPWGTGVRLIAG